MLKKLRGARALLVGVSTSTLIVATGSLARAQGAPNAQQGVVSLDAIVISADKVEGTVYDSPSVVSVKTDKEIDRQNINTPHELVRDEPAISIGNQPARTGGTNYVIRGIGDNRVRLEIDGVKVPDFPVTNLGAGTYTRDFIDFDSLKRVEIIRGPASALYGSDAIGGVVSFVTKDPSDYLTLVGKDWFVSNKTGFDTQNRSVYDTATAAGRVGPWESMVLYTHRMGHENKINSYREPNPQDAVSDNVLTKLVHTSDWGQVKLTGEFLKKSVLTDLNSEEIVTPSAGTGDPGSRMFFSQGKDTTERKRVSLDWNAPASSWFTDEILTKLYYTNLFREELTDQFRASSATALSATQLRTTDSDFLQDIYGAEIRATARRELLGWQHILTYGVTGDITETSRPRDRSQITLATGAVTKTVAGETFPNKNFPDTRTEQTAFYVQDIAQYGALRVIPAVRFDHYHLTPLPDADFARSNLTGTSVNEQTANAVSPKLGATYGLTEHYRLFAQYSRGFRAPPYDNANFGFRNTAFFYEILPNGNLKPETSDGFEGGLRGRFDNGSSFQVTAFYNKYKDFIETVTLKSPPPPTLTQFKYQNLSRVAIWGFEGRAEWWFLPEWALFGNFAYAHGTNEETGAPIDSVDPFTAVAGVRYRHNGWTGDLRARTVATKDRVSAPGIFVVPQHTTVDALLSYEVMPRFTINAGVYNIFDLAYFNPQDVAGLTATNPNLELFKAPGRTFAMNAILRW